jgi:uncharacterized protein (TIGR00730 family)
MAKLSAVCVYCGSSFGNDRRHREAAAELGRLLAERGITLVYGGGGIGLMGALANASLAAGGTVIGVIPRFLERAEKGLHELARLETVDSMHARKERMYALADGFIVLPGGLGTLDETFETLTWKQLGLHDKPLVLVDLDGYWRPLTELIEKVIAHGFAQPRIVCMFRVASSVEEALDFLVEAPEPAALPAEPDRL